MAFLANQKDRKNRNRNVIPCTTILDYVTSPPFTLALTTVTPSPFPIFVKSSSSLVGLIQNVFYFTSNNSKSNAYKFK